MYNQDLQDLHDLQDFFFHVIDVSSPMVFTAAMELMPALHRFIERTPRVITSAINLHVVVDLRIGFILDIWPTGFTVVIFSSPCVFF